jgi:hypothetical protein
MRTVTIELTLTVRQAVALRRIAAELGLVAIELAARALSGGGGDDAEPPTNTTLDRAETLALLADAIAEGISRQKVLR